jgi:hypothetical protein
MMMQDRILLAFLRTFTVSIGKDFPFVHCVVTSFKSARDLNVLSGLDMVKVRHAN